MCLAGFWTAGVCFVGDHKCALMSSGCLHAKPVYFTDSVATPFPGVVCPFHTLDIYTVIHSTVHLSSCTLRLRSVLFFVLLYSPCLLCY
jgi:hypothetical protein